MNSTDKYEEDIGRLTEALAASQREREQLQARVEAAEKLAAKWEKNCDAASFDQWHAQQLRAALASPPAAPVQAEGEK